MQARSVLPWQASIYMGYKNPKRLKKSCCSLNKSGLLLIVTNGDAQEEITNEQPKKNMLVNGN
jgi:hypothetical protein